MTNYLTIDELTATTSAASGDFIPIWRTANGDTRKISKANFMGGVLTGGGTIATGGYTLTLTGTVTLGALNGSLTGGGTIATGGYELTVPKTGTAIVGTGTDGRIAAFSGDGNTLAAATLIKSGNGVLTLSATDAYTLTVPKTGTVVTGTGTAGKVAEWVTDANTVQASTLTKSGAGELTLTASDTAALTVTGTSAIAGTVSGSGTVATGGFTLTVPATGTAALLGTAQTFTQLQTFSAGIAFANETLSTYDEGTWTPAITGSTNPTVSYTSRSGTYVRINNLVLYTATIVVNTISGGSGNARFSLPFDTATSASGTALTSSVDLAASAANIIFQPQNSVSYGFLITGHDNAAFQVVGVSALTAGSFINYSGLYFTS